VLMAWGITIMDHDSHSLEWQERKQDVLQGYNDYRETGNIIKNKDWSNVPIEQVVIKDRCWIEFNASILKGLQLVTTQ